MRTFPQSLWKRANALFADLGRYFAGSRDAFVRTSVRVGEVFSVENFSEAEVARARDLSGMLSLISTRVTRGVVEHYEKIRKETQIPEGHRQSPEVDGT